MWKDCQTGVHECNGDLSTVVRRVYRRTKLKTSRISGTNIVAGTKRGRGKYKTVAHPGQRRCTARTYGNFTGSSSRFGLWCLFSAVRLRRWRVEQLGRKWKRGRRWKPPCNADDLIPQPDEC